MSPYHSEEMDGYRMLNFFSLDHYINKCFKGFVAKDTLMLPVNMNIPGSSLVILNTDNESGEGKHWCAIFLESSNHSFEFFDPYGLPPSAYGVNHFFEEHKRPVFYSKKVVQSFTSNVCGYHCMFFAYYRCRGISLHNILKFYVDDLEKNDVMVSTFLYQFGNVYKI